MPDFVIKRHDRLPVIQATLSADLTTAVSVDFIMRPAGGGTVKVNAAATVVDAAAGIVEYQWLAVDTDTAGEFEAEWEVHWGSSRTQTFPTLEYHTIEILADLDNAV